MPSITAPAGEANIGGERRKSKGNEVSFFAPFWDLGVGQEAGSGGGGLLLLPAATLYPLVAVRFNVALRVRLAAAGPATGALVGGAGTT